MTVAIVCGGRDYGEQQKLNEELHKLRKELGLTKIIEGGAMGADSLARTWAATWGMECETVEAEWKKFGKAAGNIRNEKMAKKRPEYCIAFPGGRGTTDMKKTAKKYGIQVIEIT